MVNKAAISGVILACMTGILALGCSQENETRENSSVAEKTADLSVQAEATTATHGGPATEAAMRFVRAIQKEDFQYVWNHFLRYRQHVERIRTQNPRVLWDKLEKEAFEREKGASNVMTQWRPVLHSGTLRPVEERVAGLNKLRVFVQVSHQDRSSSPLADNYNLLRELMLELEVVGSERIVSEMAHLPAGDVAWPNDEETAIVIARRLEKSNKIQEALTVLKSPSTPDGRRLKGELLYQHAFRRAFWRYGMPGDLEQIREAVELFPPLKEKLLSDVLASTDPYVQRKQEELWNLGDAMLNLQRLHKFFPGNVGVTGRIVQNALLQAAAWLCRGGNPNTMYPGDQLGFVDLALKLGGRSKVTREIANNLTSTYRNQHAAAEYRKLCGEAELTGTYPQGQVWVYLKGIPVENLVESG